ncbi:MAG TPA: hypothetical protein VIY48_05110 [Candidatus Paceibacterota bacterium]
MFEIGQEVVCVDTHGDTGRNPYSEAAAKHLENGRVYKIKGIRPFFNEVFLSLHGVDGFWYYKRFKPVEKKKTDISVFTEMLNQYNKGVKRGIKA